MATQLRLTIQKLSFRPHWQEKGFLPKHLAFIWADMLGQAVYFMNSTCIYIHMLLSVRAGRAESLQYIEEFQNELNYPLLPATVAQF